MHVNFSNDMISALGLADRVVLVVDAAEVGMNWDMTAYTSGTQGAAIAWFVSLDCHSAHPGVFGSSAMGLAVYGSYATGHVSPPVSQDNHPYVQFGRHRREPTWSSSFRE